uniref:Ribosomal protein S20 n=1 Tax=Renouxia sp. TaxID=2485823 RepID=A0A3G3MHH8_9FLOR|nr:ribosomal protein S20 [Renouxia sp.]
MSKNSSVSKKMRVASRNKLRNKIYKSSIKTIVKKFLADVNHVNSTDIQEMRTSVARAYSKIDKAVKKGVLHKNQGARKKASLAKAIKQRMLQQ